MSIIKDARAAQEQFIAAASKNYIYRA